MNTLQQLNQYDETIVYTDLRPIGPVFDRDPINQILNFNEGQTPIWPTGIDIIDIIDYVSTNLIVTFDVSSQPGATLGWSSVPSHLTIQNSNGVYTISGIRTVEDWVSIRNPIIYAAISVFGNYSFTCTLQYLTTNTKQYTVSGNIVNIQEFTAPQTFWYSGSTDPQLVIGTPSVNTNPDPTPVWSVTIYPDNTQVVTLLSSNGTGGSTSFNSETKTLTINGSNTQINSHLNTLSITLASTEVNFNLIYMATHLVEGYSDTVIQKINSAANRYLGYCLPNVSYIEDDIVAYDNTPYITEEEYTGTENYIYKISVSDLTAISRISCVGNSSFGTMDYATRTYTITRPKNEINASIKKIKIDASDDYVGTFDITYSITSPTGAMSQKVTTATVVENLPEVINIEYDRSYSKNLTAFLFPTNRPQIVDNDITSVYSYIIQLSSTDGKFKLSSEGTAYNTWSLTGSKELLNTAFSTIQFIPNTGLYADTTATYTQTKNGPSGSKTQVTQVINIIGPRIDHSTPTNQSITVFEGQDHTVPVGMTISAVLSPFTYTINVGNLVGATVIWDTIPDGCVVTNPSTGIYTISNIDSVAKWDIVKSPRITLRNDTTGVFTYSATVYTTRSLSWNVTATITDVAALNSTTSSTFVPGTSTKLTGTTSINDAGNITPTWTVTVTPHIPDNVTTMSSNGTLGGVSAFNPTSKVLTIVGTQDQINSHLSNLYYTGTTTNDLSVILNYYANNSQTSEVGAVNQKISSTRTTILQATRSDATFTSQTQMDLTNGPLFNASLSDVTGYTMAISAYPSTAVSNIRVNVPTGFSLRSDQINVSPMYPSMQKISQDGSVLAVFDNYTFTVNIYRFNGTTWDLSYSYSEGSGNYIYDGLIGISDDGSLVFTSKFNSATNQYTIRTHYFNGTTYVLQSTTLYVTERATTTLGDSSDGYYTVGAFSSNGLKMYSWETYTYGGADYSRLYYRTWSTTAKVWSSRTYILQTTANTVVRRIISNKTGSVAAIALDDLTKDIDSPTQLATLVNSTLTIIRTGIVNGFNLYFAINDDGSLISIYRYIYRNNGTSWVLDYTLSSTQYPIQFFDNNQLAVLDSNTVKFFIKTSSSWDLTYTDSVVSWGYLLLNMYSKNMKVKVIPNSRIMTFYTTSYIDWNGSTKVLTLTGKKSLLNSYIDKLSITPAQDTSFEIRYTGTTSASATTTRNQFITKV